jgi:hypothetical protein
MKMMFTLEKNRRKLEKAIVLLNVKPVNKGSQR